MRSPRGRSGGQRGARWRQGSARWWYGTVIRVVGLRRPSTAGLTAELFHAGADVRGCEGGEGPPEGVPHTQDGLHVCRVQELPHGLFRRQTPRAAESLADGAALQPSEGRDQLAIVGNETGVRAGVGRGGRGTPRTEDALIACPAGTCPAAAAATTSSTPTACPSLPSEPWCVSPLQGNGQPSAACAAVAAAVGGPTAVDAARTKDGRRMLRLALQSERGAEPGETRVLPLNASTATKRERSVGRHPSGSTFLRRSPCPVLHSRLCSSTSLERTEQSSLLCWGARQSERRARAHAADRRRRALRSEWRTGTRPPRPKRCSSRLATQPSRLPIPPRARAQGSTAPVALSSADRRGKRSAWPCQRRQSRRLCPYTGLGLRGAGKGCTPQPHEAPARRGSSRPPRPSPRTPPRMAATQRPLSEPSVPTAPYHLRPFQLLWNDWRGFARRIDRPTACFPMKIYRGGDGGDNAFKLNCTTIISHKRSFRIMHTAAYTTKSHSTNHAAPLNQGLTCGREEGTLNARHASGGSTGHPCPLAGKGTYTSLTPTSCSEGGGPLRGGLLTPPSGA
eukprot:scaffold15185_cov107-Isochrysis_galbana.AAC.2